MTILNPSPTQKNGLFDAWQQSKRAWIRPGPARRGVASESRQKIGIPETAAPARSPLRRAQRRHAADRDAICARARAPLPKRSGSWRPLGPGRAVRLPHEPARSPPTGYSPRARRWRPGRRGHREPGPAGLRARKDSYPSQNLWRGPNGRSAHAGHHCAKTPGAAVRRQAAARGPGGLSAQ